MHSRSIPVSDCATVPADSQDRLVKFKTTLIQRWATGKPTVDGQSLLESANRSTFRKESGCNSKR